jgi:hypothetical protein
MATITFDVTGTQVWDLLIVVKMRIRRLEDMLVSRDIYTELEKVEFERDLESMRMWEHEIMSRYMDIDKEERFSAIFDLKSLCD